MTQLADRIEKVLRSDVLPKAKVARIRRILIDFRYWQQREGSHG